MHWGDRLVIHRIGLYMGRRGVLVVWTPQELLVLLSTDIAVGRRVADALGTAIGPATMFTYGVAAQRIPGR